MTKLILIEGLPGAGKSTISEALARHLANVRHYTEEAPDHPVDLDGVAVLSREEWEAEELPDSAIHDEGSYGRLVRYGTLAEDQAKRLSEKDAYSLPFAAHVELMKERWTRFAGRAAQEEAVYLFDCAFLQNPLTIGMISQDVEEELVTRYIEDVSRLIEALDPVLIYIEENDVSASFRRAYAERPDGWKHGFVDYYTGQAYGIKHGLTGIEGTIAVMKERKKRELALLGRLGVKSFRIVNERDASPDELALRIVTDIGLKTSAQ
ncbi:P-loop NTPase family protein [Exiguobacterium flavidum]|uniref:hypothetical protein n=1 Tax=Exiguobacterium flavidum TaxID=2184695 RepID=UPI000DF740EC|nr:hypothetical protein [Exiguobacterium flavidum]